MYPVSAFDLLRQRGASGCCLSLGDRLLDATCGGGIFTNSITEISGEAGAGKTQFCLVLSLRCQLDRSLGGLGGSAVYLCCGEGQFPDRRFVQLADAFAVKYQGISCSRPLSQRDFLNNVHVLTVQHTEHALEVLGKSVPELCQRERIRLLILDSMAGMARTEFDSSQRDDMKKRTTALFSLAAKLKWLADTFNLCIVVVNQVTATGFDTALSSCGTNFSSNAHDSKPALGLVWSTCVNTRIMLRRGRGVSSQNLHVEENEPPSENLVNADQSVTKKRTFHLEVCPYKAPAACTYKICSDGITGISMIWTP